MSPEALAGEIELAYAVRTPLVPPSERFPGFDLATGYQVEAELAKRRAAQGHRAVGRKIGFANRAVWRVFKLDTVGWAHMYDDTVLYAREGAASLSLGRMIAPKLEPEIVFKLARAPEGDPGDPAAVLAAVEWLAPGFEIVDAAYPNWKFTPPDFVAAYGLHAGLVVGAPVPVTRHNIPALAEQLGMVQVALWKDDAIAAQGSGKNVLGNPALALGELARGLARQAGADPLAAGELVASGALTDNQFIAPGERWSVVMQGLPVARLSLATTG
jgi:2-oxo-3-hexenedioate decarboxylase